MSALIETLSQVQAFCQARHLSCYLVGGLLRDQLLGRLPASLNPAPRPARPGTPERVGDPVLSSEGWGSGTGLPWGGVNVDLAIPRQALAISRELATRLHGAFVPLDEAVGSARVVVAAHGERIELDVSEFRGPTLEADLARRDFTINAIAIALQDWLHEPNRPVRLIDPLQGQQALARKQLLPCFPGTFDEDPVRILRAFRFAAQLEFTVDPSAIPLMTRARGALSRVSGERIRDELFAIFETDRAHTALRALNDLGALEVIVPELALGRGVEQGGFHHLDVLGHQLETVAQADRFLSDFVEFSVALRTPLAAY